LHVLVRAKPILILCALLLAAWTAPAAAQVGTAATLHEEIRALLDRTASQWAGMTTAAGDFVNPFPADLARGHGSFVPPMLAYAVDSAGQRNGSGTLVRAAERAWPRIVDPVRASAFDMVGAAYAYRKLSLSSGRRAQLRSYMSRYGIPLNGYRCLSVPGCYGNLKLVDALAVLAITRNGVIASDPAARLANPVAARAAARRVINKRIGRIVDHGVRARIGRGRIRGSFLSDPSLNTVAYHALSAFMLSEAVRQLGPAASRSARRASRETMHTLALLVAPDGDASYLGRGQGQVWVPALVAAAMANGARAVAARNPQRAGGYLAVSQSAVRRLERLHASARGLQLVPGAATRATANGIDSYAHTVAYNGLALFGLTAALDALARIPAVPIGLMPAGQRMALEDPVASGLGVVSSRRVWLAVHRKPTADSDARFDFGALALKRLTPTGWVDMLAPRPLAPVAFSSAGPALMRRGMPVLPRGYDIDARRKTVEIRDAGYHVGNRWLRHPRFRWRLTPTGVRMTVRHLKRGDQLRMLVYTQPGTGIAGPRTLTAYGALWTFDRPIAVRRLPGYHSGPVENLDALEVLLTVPRSRRIAVTIGI
jgi:hypothetical protein